MTIGSALVATTDHVPSASDSMGFAALPGIALTRTIKIDALHGSLHSLAQGQVDVQRSAAAAHGWSVGKKLDFSSPSGIPTVIVCTHQLLGLESLCDDIVILKDGHLIATGESSSCCMNDGPNTVTCCRAAGT